ncbi:hypothetical protein Q1695_005281 [Nippostrongylus brasiliensis]|nr:hypothetical protein Q1695_005281 [Nippostrongylus brasiliensis]
MITGLQYTIGRVPIASCDFSTREYSYAETPGDFALASFNLTEEDFLYKIPFIVQAQLLSGNKTRFFASPWSAPGWMKTNGRMKGGGRLRGDEDGPYYKAWANYFIRFFGEYHRNGVDFWGMTIQNEPEAGLDPNWGWQAMYFNARMERNFVKNLLGPALKSRSYTKNIKLMINDDQRITLPEWADTVLNDTEAAKYVSGIAIHWYTDKMKPASVLTTTHDRHPNHFILGTEACTGYLPGEHKPLLGNWTRAEEYLTDIIEDLSNWVVGWTDWNLCLDMKGGPNWVGNFVDAPVIVDAAKQEYYKQPMWYAMAHISKFVPPDSRRIGSQFQGAAPPGMAQLAFLDPEGRRVIAIANTDSDPHTISIKEHDSAVYYNTDLPAHSFLTVVLG